MKGKLFLIFALLFVPFFSNAYLDIDSAGTFNLDTSKTYFFFHPAQDTYNVNNAVGSDSRMSSANYYTIHSAFSYSPIYTIIAANEFLDCAYPVTRIQCEQLFPNDIIRTPFPFNNFPVEPPVATSTSPLVDISNLEYIALLGLMFYAFIKSANFVLNV